MENIMYLFIAPKELYTSIKEKTTILFTILIVAIALILGTIIVFFNTQPAVENEVTKLINMGPSFLNNMYLNNKTTQLGLIIFSLFISIILLLTVIINTAVLTTFILLLTKIFGGEGNFKTFFNMYFYNHIVVIACILVNIPFLFVTILLNVEINFVSLFNFIMPNADVNSPIYMVLSHFTISSIYCFILNVIGVREIAEFESNVKPVIILTIMYSFSVLMEIGLDMLVNVLN